MDDNNRPDSKLLKILDHCLRTVILALMFCVGFILGVSIFGHALCYADDSFMALPSGTALSSVDESSFNAASTIVYLYNSGYPEYERKMYSTSGDVYFCTYKTSDNKYSPLLLSHDSDATFQFLTRSKQTSSSSNTYQLYPASGSSSSLVAYSDEYPGVYIAGRSLYTTSSTTYTIGPVYDSLDDAIQAFYTYTPTTETTLIKIPRGYYALFSVNSSNFTISGHTTFNRFSPVGGTLPFLDTTQGYCLFNTAAIEGDPLTDLTNFVFQPYGSPNAYQQYKSGLFTETISSSGYSYFAIVNPVYMAGYGNNMDKLNLNEVLYIDIPADKLEFLRYFPLSTTVTGAVGAVHSNVSPDDPDVDYSSSAAVDLLPDNGGTDVDEPQGLGDVIKQWLDTLIENIKSLFDQGISHITQLINLSSNFFTFLTRIWSWLPAPVYSLAVSALSVIIIVGALKFLWRH